MPRHLQPYAGCVHSYSARHLDPDEARAYRSKFERSWTRRLSHKRERKLILRAYGKARHLAPLQPRVLDYPCGAGRFSPAFASSAGEFTIADHSPAMIELAKEALGASGFDLSRLHSVVGDAREMPLDEESIDLACCIRLLHHFKEQDDRLRILRGFRRVCRGPLVCTYLSADSPKQWIHQLRCQLERRESRRSTLSAQELATEAQAAGYRLAQTWSLSGWFSGQCVALLTPMTR